MASRRPTPATPNRPEVEPPTELHHEHLCGVVGPECDCHPDLRMTCTREPGHRPPDAHYNVEHGRNWQRDYAA